MKNITDFTAENDLFFDAYVSTLLSSDYFFLGYFFIVGVNAPTEIDSSISRAVKDSNKISKVKNIIKKSTMEISLY